MSTLKIALCVMVALLITFVDAKKSPRTPGLVTINTSGMFGPVPLGYSHIRVDMRTAVACIAGQVAANISSTLVGNNLEQQLKDKRDNTNIAMKAIGSSVPHIMSVTVYIKNYD